MALKCSVFIATSLDGFIARKDGALDWLPGSGGTAGGEDYGYGSFFASVDTLIIGRKTYELAASFADWPYRGKKVVVLSSRYPATGTRVAAEVQGLSCSPMKLVHRLANEGARHACVDGGATIQGFLRAGAIQEITVTRVPVLIGEGMPLFGPLDGDIALRHVQTRAYDNGMVQSIYTVAHTLEEPP